jgi:hypothetical protein
MTPLLRTAFGSVAIVSLALASGCVVHASAESATRFEGTPVQKSPEWHSGQAVHILSQNGSVDVVGGSQTDSVKVTFEPFTMKGDSEQEEAKREIENSLQMLAGVDGDTVNIEIHRDGGSSYLGCDIKVVLPSGFDGGFKVTQNNGSIDADLRKGTPTATDINSDNGGVNILGAAGSISIVSGNGSGSVSVAQWPASGEHKVTLGNGDLDFSLPAGANGTMEVWAQDEMMTINDAGISFPSTENAPGSKSYTMGEGTGGLMKITTEFGDINLSTN